ncbi:hypothetical protein AAC387_Pa06g1645 [Persea americana]
MSLSPTMGEDVSASYLAKAHRRRRHARQQQSPHSRIDATETRIFPFPFNMFTSSANRDDACSKGGSRVPFLEYA